MGVSLSVAPAGVGDAAAGCARPQAPGCVLKALRRVINKYVYIKFIESLLMTKKSTRARLDQPVNRIEFNRFDPAVELKLGEDASGASEPTLEKKNRPKRSGLAKATHLHSSPKSADAGSLASGKKSSKKSEKLTSARKAGEAAELSSPKPSGSKFSEDSGKKSARREDAESSLSSDEISETVDEVKREAGDAGQLDVDPSFWWW